MSIHSKIPYVPQHISTRVIGNEAFVMNLITLKTYALNETAAKIWQLVDGLLNVGDISSRVMEEYEISGEEYFGDIEETIKQLSAEGLIEFAE